MAPSHFIRGWESLSRSSEPLLRSSEAFYPNSDIENHGWRGWARREAAGERMFFRRFLSRPSVLLFLKIFAARANFPTLFLTAETRRGAERAAAAFSAVLRDSAVSSGGPSGLRFRRAGTSVVLASDFGFDARPVAANGRSPPLSRRAGRNPRRATVGGKGGGRPSAAARIALNPNAEVAEAMAKLPRRWQNSA